MYCWYNQWGVIWLARYISPYKSGAQLQHEITECELIFLFCFTFWITYNWEFCSACESLTHGAQATGQGSILHPRRHQTGKARTEPSSGPVDSTTNNGNRNLLDYLLLFESPVLQETLKSIAEAPRRHGKFLHYRQRTGCDNSARFWNCKSHMCQGH